MNIKIMLDRLKKSNQIAYVEYLLDNGYLIKQQGTSYNMPMQRYIEQGLFEVKESTFQNPDGSVRVTRTTKVTGKGQVYFVNKFLSQDERIEKPIQSQIRQYRTDTVIHEWSRKQT